MASIEERTGAPIASSEMPYSSEFPPALRPSLRRGFPRGHDERCAPRALRYSLTSLTRTARLSIPRLPAAIAIRPRGLSRRQHSQLRTSARRGSSRWRARNAAELLSSCCAAYGPSSIEKSWPVPAPLPWNSTRCSGPRFLKQLADTEESATAVFHKSTTVHLPGWETIVPNFPR